MRRTDRKLEQLAAMVPGRSGRDLDVLGRLVELVEGTSGAVVAPAGVPGRWCTLVLEGAVATTSPYRVHVVGDVLDHGSQNAVVALEDVRLATVAAADAVLLADLVPVLLPALPDVKELVR